MMNAERYSRHIILKVLGAVGQEKLSRSSVAIVGAGALGNACANLVARAGVGSIRVIDRDIVELSNLQRQILFTEKDIGKSKAEALCAHLKKINSTCRIECNAGDFNAVNGEELLSGIDLVLDCTDNLRTRFLINDICVKHSIPWIYAGVLGTSGMTYNVVPGRPCFRCIFPALPGTPLPTCETTGILNTVPVFFAMIQVTEAIKILTGKEPRKTLAFVDLWDFEVQEIEVARNPECPACVEHNFEFLDDKTVYATSLCGSNAVYIAGQKKKISIDEIKRRLAGVAEVKKQGSVLHIRVEGKEITLFPNGAAIIKGTTSQDVAKSVYDRYVGG